MSRRARLRELAGSLRDTVLRMFPHRAPTGLLAVGRPGPDSPVLLTGNYTLTVRRVLRALRGVDAWLLVADSRGINVWCAAGGGHLTHHDVITAIRAARLDEKVRHRRIVLPQLAAPGVERRKVAEATGWKVVWGPVRAEDLPAFLGRGLRATREEREVRFSPADRLEMAAVWAGPMTAIAGPVAGLAGGWPVGLAAALLVPVLVGALFLAAGRLPVQGASGAVVYAGAALAGTVAGEGMLALAGAASPGGAVVLLLVLGAAMAVLSIDLAGTTPLMPSTVNRFRKGLDVELLPDRCTGGGECLLVCPRGVLRMDGRRRKAVRERPERCLWCGACIVQCPADAVRFRTRDGRVLPPDEVRGTRLDLLGRRSIRI
ncbi:MAG: 4Fe-4S dicluster domain-containing protein [Acidobacteria bacterium]|nr:MAG: 4Fe-4S dicluster domain-containing protein [Acidobacteriota bacterium]